VVRNRNTALRTLAAWGRERWPPEAVEAVVRAADQEPVADVKGRFMRVLAGEPFDEPEPTDETSADVGDPTES
jgi:hypothetical protein